MGYSIYLLSVPVNAQSSTEISSDSLENAEIMAREYLRSDAIKSWYAGSFVFIDQLALHYDVKITYHKVIEKYSVEYNSEAVVAGISTDIEIENEQEALKYFKSIKHGLNWTWNGIEIPFDSIQVDKMWILNNHQNKNTSISEVIKFPIRKVGIPIPMIAVVEYDDGGSTGYADGEVTLNGADRSTLSGGSHMFTLVPDKAGVYHYSVEYYGYKYSDKTLNPSTKLSELIISKGDFDITINTPNLSITKGLWFPITMSCIAHPIEFKIMTNGVNGKIKIGSGYLNSIGSMFLCMYNKSVVWGSSQSITVEYEGGDDYNPSISNSISVNVT